MSEQRSTPTSPPARHEHADHPEHIEEKLIFNEEEMRRAITRIAHEIIERNAGAGNLTLIGMLTRGAPLAHRLAARINDLEGVVVPVAELDATPYRDDLPERPQHEAGENPPLPVEVTGRVVTLVD